MVFAYSSSVKRSLPFLLAFSLACTGSINGDEPDDPFVPPPIVEPPPPPFEPAPAALPRLTHDQYRNSLRDVLGIEIPAVELEADTNPYLFFNIGGASTTLSERGVIQYDDAAHAIANAIFADAATRDGLVGCDPTASLETSCVESFIERFGRRLFRRSLDETTRTRWTTVAQNLGDGDAWRGLRYAVAGMLQSPLFLYRAEVGVPAGEERRLDGFELASKLSYLLWNTTPDDALLDAAEAGELDTDAGLYEQALRLLEDERSQRATQEFFAQYLDLGRLDQVELDPVTYPLYTSTIAQSMRTEVELLVHDIVFRRDADVRELLYSRQSFVNDELATLYGVDAPGATAVTFVPVELPPERAGVLTTGAFLAANAHPTETSPTLRGKYIRERILCQTVMPPPDDVNTDLPPDSMGRPATLRERLEQHRLNPQCSGCHAFIDPPGFLFEHFDSLGAWRDREPGGEIDSSGGLDGTPLAGATDLAALLQDSERVPYCMVKQLYRHTMGRLDEPTEREALVELQDAFAASGYRFRELLLAFATSDAFRTIAPAEGME